MDTFKDKQLLEDIYTRGQVPVGGLEAALRPRARPARGRAPACRRSPRGQVNSISILEAARARSGSSPWAPTADDIEIGCGGTILRLIAERRGLEVLWVVFCSTPERAAEARASARRVPRRRARGEGRRPRATGTASSPTPAPAVKDEFEALKREFSPDLVFTHYREDRHQDHRLVSDLTWNTWRDHFILEYEIPKYDGDFGSPNFFAPPPRGDPRSQDRPAPGALPIPGGQGLVHRGPVPGGRPDPRHGVGGSAGRRRGVLLQQGELLSATAAVEAGRAPTRPRAQRRGAGLLAIALLAAAALALPTLQAPVLRAAGGALVAEDPLGPADIVVVATGADGAGVLEAADLVERGVAPRVAVFADPPDPVVDREFLRRGVPYENAAARSVRQLRALGVQAAAIEEVPRSVAGTEDEGRVLPEWCAERRFRSVLVVTTWDHSRRLRRLLRRSMQGHETRVGVRASRYSRFDPDRWWSTREGIRTGIVEMQKLLFDVARHPIS